MNEKNPGAELRRMMSEASDARANFRVWQALELSKDDRKRLQAMNDYSWVDFFRVTIWGTQTLAFLFLAKIFDRSKGALKIRDIAKSLDDKELITDLEKLLKTHGPVIEKIKHIRDKTVAHNQRGLDEKIVFEHAGITPDEMEHLIEDVCKILNDAARRQSFVNLIPEDLRFRDAVHALLGKLGAA